MKQHLAALVGIRVRDTYPNGKRWGLRLHGKGGKFHEVPAHRKNEEYLDPCLEAPHTQAAPLTEEGRTGPPSSSTPQGSACHS